MAPGASSADATATPCELGEPEGGDTTQTYTFETDPLGNSGWNLEGSHPHVRWHITPHPGGGVFDDTTGHSRPLRLTYRNANATSAGYETAENPNKGTATSPPMGIPKDLTEITLRFTSKYEIESRDPSTYDQMTVHTSTDGGTTWTLVCRVNPTTAYGGFPAETVCSNGTPEGAYPCPRDATGAPQPAWEFRSVPLPNSVAGHDILVRFTFETGDGHHNEAMGWMVDDIQLAGETPPDVPALAPIAMATLVGGLAVTGAILTRRQTT